MEMMMMGEGLITEGCNIVSCNQSEVSQAMMKTCPYTQEYNWHFWYQLMVDDHSNLYQEEASLEVTWKTDR